MGETITDEAIRKLWRDAGGSFYGPRVEHANIRESDFLPFMRALLARIDNAEAWGQKPGPTSDVRDGFPSKIEWIRAYRAKHNAPLKDAKEAYENGTPLDGAPATFEVHQDGTPVALASGPRDRAYAEAMHYAAVYGQDGPVEVFEHVPVPLPKAEG